MYQIITVIVVEEFLPGIELPEDVPPKYFLSCIIY